ncbi:MAG: DUF6515 family protein [Candidatus Cryptobacteroides sp.]|nr:hypothetical protein [Bacteroidales bacterium]MCI6046479.1 hypothetical protein [Alistipes sp.]MDY4726315.1 DUF6515 family protein [Candidatus Cryptobacteroides sp.]MDY5200051.1 DUF6515 family protein [Candidatus Cryptobacteroides sp.]
MSRSSSRSSSRSDDSGIYQDNNRRSGTGSSRNSSATSSRSSQDNNRRSSSAVRSSSSSDRNSSSVREASSSTRSSGDRVARPVGGSSATRSSSARGSATDVRREQSQRVGNATRGGLTSYDRNAFSGKDVMKENRSDFIRIGEDRNVHRIPPRDRDFMPYDRPCHFWGHNPHYYGYRVHKLPPRHRRITYWGVEYCIYDGIYYRPYGNFYVVCRPPFGVCIDRAVSDLMFASVRFAYYNNTYRMYRAIDSNNRIIEEQNRIIARNNATIAAQNNSFALNSARANSAYSLADRLGLVQSYAYANQPYYYQDGVFYIVNSNGQYEVIVPPSGALVEDLPDDYDTITLDGMDFYKVDDTVYRLTLVEGKPYLEVLGQMYGRLANQYNYYSNRAVSYNSLY